MKLIEAVNEQNQGRYFDGFAATCPVTEDFTQPLGATSEPLLAAVYEEVLKAGGHPILNVSLPGQSAAYFKHASDAELEAEINTRIEPTHHANHKIHKVS